MSRKVIFTEEQKQQIIESYKSGKSARKLAKEIGVADSFLGKWLKKNGVSPNPIYRKYSLNQDAFADAENNPEAAYWVGFLMADGSITEDQWCRGYTVGIGVAEIDGKHIEKLRDFLKAGNPITKGKNGNGIIVSLKVNSLKMARDLRKYGITPRKSLTAKVKLLEDNIHFWRGMIDGDGCLFWKKSNFPYPQLGLCGSRDTINQYLEFVEKNIGKSRKIMKNSSIFSLVMGGTKAKKLAEILYKGHEPYLIRKMEVAKEFFFMDLPFPGAKRNLRDNGRKRSRN